MADLEAFRTEARDFLEKNGPKVLRGKPIAMPETADAEAAELEQARRDWLKRMADRGWTAPTWPTEYGGGGLSRKEARVVMQEMAALELPTPLVGMGLSMIGPTLLVHGNDEQKNHYLPKIVSGEHRWCQGFSEPNAGSDLASLACQAKLDESGDNYIVNGQKTWTSGGQFANHIFMLVRTDETTKHNGITFILSPMDDPGIEIRPIRLISGNSPFCETFFSDVKIPVKNVVGGVNNGWTVAKALLGFERSGMGGTGTAAGPRRGSAAFGGSRLTNLAKTNVGLGDDGKIADGKIREDMTQVMLDQLALSLTQQRAAATAKATGAPGAETSIFKIVASELGHRRDELMLRLRGTLGLVWDEGSDAADMLLTRAWLSAKATTIYGGTSEIQRNIVSKRVLGLPQPKN